MRWVGRQIVPDPPAAPSSQPSPPGGPASADPSADGPRPAANGWWCDEHGTGAHDVFLSYRVAVDGPGGSGAVEAIFNALDGQPLAGGDANRKLACFWDKKCLNKGARLPRLWIFRTFPRMQA